MQLLYKMSINTHTKCFVHEIQLQCEYMSWYLSCKYFTSSHQFASSHTHNSFEMYTTNCSNYLSNIFQHSSGKHCTLLAWKCLLRRRYPHFSIFELKITSYKFCSQNSINSNVEGLPRGRGTSSQVLRYSITLRP